MKIAVFSDSHGQTRDMLRAIQASRPDVIFHLGDVCRDTAPIGQAFPDIPLYAVRGNCDFAAREETVLFLTLGGTRFFLTHGHLYGVKSGLYDLIDTAKKRGADAVLFGHTHRAHMRFDRGMYVINPGAAGSSGVRSWAELDVNEKEPGALVCTHRFFES
ncbi:MAG: metallophosphoesterase [Firmicutes bacterium]|nr:metallophosphoesterase [Bacillota bacterium]